MYDQNKHPLLYVPCYIRGISREWEKALSHGREYCYRKNEIFNLGNNEESFGYIKSGMTCCYYSDPFGCRDEIRFFLGDGCLIKETFILANCGFYVTHHKCLTDVRLYLFKNAILFDRNFLITYPDLLQNLNFSISIKSVSIQLFTSIIRRHTNLEKVAIYLYGFYLHNCKKKIFEPPFSQLYLAELLGLSKFTINRIILKLKKDNILITYTKKRIELGDIEALAKIVSYNAG